MNQVGGQDVVDTHQKTTGNDCRDDRNKDVTQHLYETLKQIAFFLLCLVFGCLTLDTELFLNLIADKIDGACSENNLEL